MRYSDGRGPLPPAGLHQKPWKGISVVARRHAQTRTVLYRFFAGDGKLLYIGITLDVETRWQKHAAEAQWWHLQARSELEWFDSRGAAELAERAAVKAEKPLFNFVYAEPGTGRKGARHLPERRAVARPPAPAWQPAWSPDPDQAALLEAVRVAASVVDALGKSALPELHRALDEAWAAGVPGPVLAQHSKRSRTSAGRLTESMSADRP